MKSFPMRRKLVTAIGMLMLAGCGGGSMNVGGGGIGGTGVSSGPITGFGSIFVNGVEYDVSSANIIINGVAATEAALKVGMIVKVRGDRSGATGSALEVEFDSDIEGVVNSVNAANNTLTVMGQVVVVDNLTVFEGTTMATLTAGNIVEVSGWTDASGSIHATRIEYKKDSFSAGTDELEVDGTVSNLDTAAMTFTLGALTVYYGNLNVTLANGQSVEVKSTQGMNGSNQLVASSIESEDDALSAEEGEEAELQGIVTSFTSSALFEVNGHVVKTDANTEFENGTAGDIAEGERLEVEGTVNASGELVADKISLRPRSEIELEGNVEAVNSTAKTITVLGQTFSVDAMTQMEDEEGGDRYFNISGINVGDRLEVKVFQRGSALVASRIERVSASSSSSLQGIVESVDAGASTLVILGTTVDVQSVDLTAAGIADITGLAGQLVQVEGSMDVNTGIFVATELEIED